MGKKRKSYKASRSSVAEPSPAGGPRRYLALGAFCIFVAGAVVVASLALRPIDDANLVEPWKMPELPKPTIQLPREPEKRSNEEIQAEGIREAKAIVARFPRQVKALHAAAMLYAGVNQTAKAERLWRTCLELDPGASEAAIGLAIALSEQGRDEEAADILSKQVSSGHSSALLFHQLGTIQTKLGRLDEAEASAREGVRSDPGIAANWLLLGQTQLQRREFAEAEANLRKAVELDGRSLTAVFALSNACMRQGKRDEALKFRKQFAQMKADAVSDAKDETFEEKYKKGLTPTVVSSFRLFGTFYFKHGDPDNGERLLLRALAYDPSNVRLLDELVSNYLRLGREADAYLVLKRLVQLDPQNGFYLFHLGNVAKKLGDLPSAQAALEAVIAREPDFADPYLSLAQIHAQMGDLRQARSYAEKGVAKQPSAAGYRILALACEALGDQDGAKAAQAMGEELATKNGIPRQEFPGIQK